MIQYNGINIERRRMFVNNPRNNLVSNVSIVWQNSVQEHDTPRLQKQQRREKEHRQISEQYNSKIGNKLQETINLANSQQFRVFVPQQEDDSLSRELRNYNSKSIYSPVPEQPPSMLASRKSSLGQAVFGYSIEQAPRRQNYLRRAIEERLRPHQSVDDMREKHQSFSINQPINLHY